MGIGGSGMSAAAAIAHAQKFEVSGCDVDTSADYLKPLKKLKITISKGHSDSHLSDIDILTISPAIPYVSGDNPEYLNAKGKGIVMTWQQFMGKYLHQNKIVLCVAGTHGKSTTTSLLGLCFESAGLDPTVEVGATVPNWGGNYRIGKGKYFISEADEFNDNFLNFHPNLIIINNLEMDHPEYFKSPDQLHESYLNFIRNLEGEKILIVNADHPPLRDFVANNYSTITQKGIKLISYRIRGEPLIHTDQELIAKVDHQGPDGITFSVDLNSSGHQIPYGRFKISLTGLHNVSNTLGVLAACHAYNLPPEPIKKKLLQFNGAGRRLEEIADKSGIKIFLDYAHHPSEVSASLEALRQKFPTRNIWVMFQPHMFARLKLFLQEFADSLNGADKITILPVFASRDTQNYGIGPIDLKNLLPERKTKTASSLELAAIQVGREAKTGDIILLMGAGDIYQLVPMIKEKL